MSVFGESSPAMLPERPEAGPYKTKQFKGKATGESGSLSQGAQAQQPNPMKLRVRRSKKRF